MRKEHKDLYNLLASERKEQELVKAWSKKEGDITQDVFKFLGDF